MSTRKLLEFIISVNNWEKKKIQYPQNMYLKYEIRILTADKFEIMGTLPIEFLKDNRREPN